MPFWAVLLGLVALFGLAATPILRAADPPLSETAGRQPALDGLRGIAAVLVFFYHADIYRAFLRTRHWSAPQTHVMAMLGPLAVAGFFMITGYLFWGKLLRSNGRPGFARLYVGRLCRVGPLYMTAAVLLLLGVAVQTGFQIRVPLITLIIQSLTWLNLGFFVGFTVNGYRHTSMLLDGVTWTLHDEWLFYASLLPLGWGLRFPWLRRLDLIGPLGYLGWSVFGPVQASAFADFFAVGMATAALHARGRRLRLLDIELAPAARTGWSLLIVLYLFLVCAYVPDINMPITAVALAPVFFAVASGCSLFGLLTSRAGRRLGDASYGIYLLQGLAMALVLRSPWGRAAALSPALWPYLFAVALTALLLLGMATVALVWIERPWIERGRRWGQRLRRARNTAPGDDPDLVVASRT